MESTLAQDLWANLHSISEWQVIGRKLAECLCFVTPLISCLTTHLVSMVLLWAAITSKRRLRNSKQILFLNPLNFVGTSPKKNPVENFLVRSVLQKNSLFRRFLCPNGKKSCTQILMPLTSHIATLNRHTLKFLGVGLMLTWCQPFASQVTQIRVHQNRRF